MPQLSAGSKNKKDVFLNDLLGLLCVCFVLWDSNVCTIVQGHPHNVLWPKMSHTRTWCASLSKNQTYLRSYSLQHLQPSRNQKVLVVTHWVIVILTCFHLHNNHCLCHSLCHYAYAASDVLPSSQLDLPFLSSPEAVTSHNGKMAGLGAFFRVLQSWKIENELGWPKGNSVQRVRLDYRL